MKHDIDLSPPKDGKVPTESKISIAILVVILAGHFIHQWFFI